jgi:hypothetical protein
MTAPSLRDNINTNMYVLLHVSIDVVSKRGSSHVYTTMCYYMLVLMLSLREGAVMYILVCVTAPSLRDNISTNM